MKHFTQGKFSVRETLRKKRLIYYLGRISTRLFYWIQLRRQQRMLLRNLHSEKVASKSTADSLRLYQQYNDREQQQYQHHHGVCIYRGRVAELSYREMRDYYLRYLYEEIDQSLALAGNRRLRVLEVGCGNCINLVNLRKKYGERLKLVGLDIASQRLKVAHDYFGDALQGVETVVAPITETTSWENGEFDIVFSMHCLEQIAYEAKAAVAEMYRLAAGKIVMIEPVFELANAAQRLYLINADHTRILLKSIEQLGYRVARLEPLDIQLNPVNQSSIITIDKSGQQAKEAA